MTGPEQTPLTTKSLLRRVGKERRWLTWMCYLLSKIEGQAGHRIEELEKLEARLAEQLKLEQSAKPKADPLEPS